jgi:hypothetical protein
LVLSLPAMSSSRSVFSFVANRKVGITIHDREVVCQRKPVYRI